MIPKFEFPSLSLQVLVCWLFSFSVLNAQDALQLKPPLSQVFPLDPQQEGMHVKFPVMISTRAIIRPSVILRFVYINPSQAPHFQGPDAEPGYTGGAGGGGEHHHRHGSGDPDGSSGKDGDSSGGPGKDRSVLDMPADERKEIMSEVWLRAGLFRDALDQALLAGTTFVYGSTTAKLPTVSAMNLPQGMLLGEQDHRIVVLGVADGQPAAISGIVAGDEIRAIGTSPIHSLQEFGKLYTAAEQAQQGAPQTGFTFQIWRASTGKLMTVTTRSASIGFDS